MSYKSKATSIWKQIYRVQGRVVFVLMLGISFLVFVQVILRYVLQRPLMGIEDTLLFPAIWLYFLGGAIASQERSQIRAQVIEVFIRGQKSTYWIRIIMTAIGFGVAAWLTYWSYKYLIFCISSGGYSTSLYWPLVYAQSAILIGFLLMTIYSLVELVGYIIKLTGRSW